MSVTYSLANPLKRTPHQGMLIGHTGVMEYTVIVEKGCHCGSDIIIIAEDREIEIENVSFSRFKCNLIGLRYIAM